MFMYVCIQSNLYVNRALVLNSMIQRRGEGWSIFMDFKLKEKMEFLTQVKEKLEKIDMFLGTLTLLGKNDLPLRGDSTLLHSHIKLFLVDTYLEHFYRPV